MKKPIVFHKLSNDTPIALNPEHISAIFAESVGTFGDEPAIGTYVAVAGANSYVVVKEPYQQALEAWLKAIDD